MLMCCMLTSHNAFFNFKKLTNDKLIKNGSNNKRTYWISWKKSSKK